MTAHMDADTTGYVTTLFRLGQILSSSLDVNRVLATAIEQVVKFVGAERGFILVVDENTRKVRGLATEGIDNLALEATLAGRDPSNKPEISHTIVDLALREQRGTLSTNAMEDPRFKARTSVQLSNVRSVMCIPLTVQDHVLGVVYVDNRVRSGLFDERHFEMLNAFASHAAVAIQNAQLYENLRKSMEDRLHLQDELHANERQRLALEEANRLKSDYVALVSHELRNPLTTIRGYVQTLQQDEDGTLPADVKQEFLETIEAECDRMLDLINELLDSARLDANRPLALCLRPIAIEPFLHKLSRSCRFYKAWTDRHSIRLDIAKDLPEITADEDKVHQILANLLTNAIKYSPNGGEIVISAALADGGIRIAVRDHGLGMTQEQQSRLFHRYERAERKDIEGISGTGLGLYLTRHLVELHGGTISCTSEQGKGTEFAVILPLKPTD